MIRIKVRDTSKITTGSRKGNNSVNQLISKRRGLETKIEQLDAKILLSLGSLIEEGD